MHAFHVSEETEYGEVVTFATACPSQVSDIQRTRIISLHRDELDLFLTNPCSLGHLILVQPLMGEISYVLAQVRKLALGEQLQVHVVCLAQSVRTYGATDLAIESTKPLGGQTLRSVRRLYIGHALNVGIPTHTPGSHTQAREHVPLMYTFRIIPRSCNLGFFQRTPTEINSALML